MNRRSEPETLFEQQQRFEQQLSDAGRADAMSVESRHRILAGLGVTVPPPERALTQLTRASASKAPLAGLGAAAVGAMALLAATQLWRPTPSATPAPVVNVAAPSLERAVTPEPVSVSPVAKPEAQLIAVPETAIPNAAIPNAAPEPAKTRTRSTRAAGDSLNLELAKVDSARGALQRGEAATALRILDHYSNEFPSGALRTEAQVLRIEALVANGDRATAARLGKAFLARSPNGTYARRVRALTQQL